MDMKKYSVSEAAQILEIDRRTLQRWVGRKTIPAPTPGIVNGRLARFWTEDEMVLIRKTRPRTMPGRDWIEEQERRPNESSSN